MAQNTTRIAVAVDDRRVDLTVPAYRPVGEYLLRLVDLADPRDRLLHQWHLMRVGGELVDVDLSLAQAGVVDGELVQLAPALVTTPNGSEVVDDIPTAVAAAAAPHRPGPAASGHVCHGLSAAATIGITVSLAAGGAAGGVVAAILAAAVLAGAMLLRRTGRDVDASIWAFTAMVPAAASGWAIARSASTGVWWVPPVVAAAVAAVLAAVAVPACHAILVPLAAGLVAVGAWCIVFAAGTKEPGAIGGPAVIIGFVVIEVVPRLAFHGLGVGRLHRDSSRRDAVDDRVRRARLTIVAGNVAGAVLVLVGAAALAAGDDPWGWALAAAAALVLALHTRLYTNLDELVPLAAAAIGVLTLLVTLTVLPEAGWPAAAAAAAVPALVLALAGTRRPVVRPLTRRRLARAEVLAAVPVVIATLVSSGLAETLYRTGQSFT
jgi:type VII secretion integral membrane protein EccD